MKIWKQNNNKKEKDKEKKRSIISESIINVKFRYITNYDCIKILIINFETKLVIAYPSLEIVSYISYWN